MRIAKKTHYGIQMLVSLAETPTEWQSLAKLSRRLDLPLSFLKHIASALKHTHILESQGGMRGGYRLAKPIGEISILAVFKSLSEPIALMPCRTRQCTHKTCFSGKFWKTVTNNLETAFKQSTLALVKKVNQS